MDQSQGDQPQWPAFAGVDWGGAHHQLCVVEGEGRRVSERRFPHDVAGLADLRGELQRHGERLPVAVERSEGLLVEQLQAAGHVVFPVSPRIAARARERYKVAPNRGLPSAVPIQTYLEGRVEGMTPDDRVAALGPLPGRGD